MNICLAFLNNHHPPFWKNIAVDLEQHFPVAVEPVSFDLPMDKYFSIHRNQYHSSEILHDLLSYKPPRAIKIIGITNVDLFMPILTFVFGEAQLNGQGALVSTYRLHNSFYGLPENDHLLYERTFKEALHELGHCFGLVHCKNFECVMNASTYVEDSDIKKAQFCSPCREMLDRNCAPFV